MNFYKINSNTDFTELCKLISPHKLGRLIMSEKTSVNFIFIKDISTPAANILKQDALRVGAELVTNEGVINSAISHSNALLMATKEQISKLIKKEKLQDFGLKSLAKFLENNFKKPKAPQLMAVLNINDDSFNPASRVKEVDFEKRLLELLEMKPDFIDLGAVSSRPGSEYCGRDEEFKRLKFALDLIYGKNYHKNTIFSLDSFDEYCLEYALNKGFGLINDITGLKNENLANLALKYKAKYCLMHMQRDPKTMQEAPFYEDLLGEIYEFFAKKLEILSKFKLEDMILDVGIGFGKTPQHNMLLIKHLEHFLSFEKPLLVGASRKSVIGHYTGASVDERLAGTLFLHLKAYENGAQILRVHDLKEHKQMFEMACAMQGVIFE